MRIYENHHEHGLVLFSGGQDSMTALGVARVECKEVTALSIQYRQRHAIEVNLAEEYCRNEGIPHRIVRLLDVFGSQNALTSELGDIGAAHPLDPSLPISWVPGRNALFLSVAYIQAYTVGADVVYGGMCQEDYSGYPDCRQPFLGNLWMALRQGSDNRYAPILRLPILDLTKAQTFQLADELDILGHVLEHSHSCYNGVRDQRHIWGYGCGECPACKVRAAGWEAYQELRDELEQTRAQIG